MLGADLGDVGSDHSSIITISDKMMASDTEDSELGVDTQKYRLPESDKSPIGPVSIKSLRPEPSMNGSSTSLNHSQDSPLSDAETMQRRDSERQQPEGPTDFESYISSFTHNRAASIYTLSRASFSAQLGQLTSIQLPPAASLASGISSIPTSTGAAKALNDAAQQIRRWIQKASEVLNGLNADDDVDWAAAGGREGLDDVDQAINRFEGLINVYIVAIEGLEERKDITELPASQLTTVVSQMEDITTEWKKIKDTLGGVKEQVEMAMEWEELWNTVLGEIGLEVEALGRLVFEMEERRHRNAANEADQHTGMDIGELETIVEETPNRPKVATGGQRLSLPGVPHSPSSPTPAPIPPLAKEDSNLLALFARMQPLRASLDFLPMRLSGFQTRAKTIFPTACEDLTKRREALEGKWKKLENDAESLRRELSEDQWVMIFRNAGRQAQKMSESVERSYNKLKEALDTGAHYSNLPSTAKKIESYEAKKMHYGPAIERVLAIIDRGVRDRLTVNGEILRLQSEVKRRWSHLQDNMRELNAVLEEFTVSSNSQQLRDSISTILSTEQSATSSMIDTPNSSPASSIIMMSRQGSEQEPNTPYVNGKRQSSLTRRTSRSVDPSRRHSSLPLRFSNTSAPRKPSLGGGPSHSPSRLSTSSTTTTTHRPSPPQNLSNKPRWNSSVNMQGTSLGHNFKPLEPHTPSPAKPRPSSSLARPASRTSSIPLPSPLARSSRAESPALTSPTPRQVSAPLSTSTKRQSMLGTPIPPTRYDHVPSSGYGHVRPPSSLQRPPSSLQRPPSSLQRPPSRLTRPSISSSTATATATANPSTNTNANATSPLSPGSMLPVPKSSTLDKRRSVLFDANSADDDAEIESPLAKQQPGVRNMRSVSAMAGPSSARSGSALSGRRTSMLPTPSSASKGRWSGVGAGEEGSGRPRWR
ncbi:MAG: hypothetical protein M1820_004006 [Bogoriella megaspora]|nr:MAG: hypothetical protein M1820_004006 [Bogoriella megaspora]